MCRHWVSQFSMKHNLQSGNPPPHEECRERREAEGTELLLQQVYAAFHTLPAMTLSNPQPVGIFLCQTQPPPSTGSNTARHCSTPRAGQAAGVSPQLQSPDVHFHMPGERTALADQKMGWPTELPGLRLGSKDIFPLFDHSSCHPFSCTAGVMRKKIYITVFMEQNKEGANQSNPSYQP